MSDEVHSLSANKQALLRIRELKQQLAAAEDNRVDASAYEPIAIVSMACRFPRRATTPEAFWQSLIDQTDEVSEIPNDRWDLEAFHDDDPEVPGKMYARQGVFLDNIDLMDPEFFGISPREATWVDPQQRLLMEAGWEALERAGWLPEEIGEHTGIFVGWMHNDYQNEASDSFLNLNPYIATGAAGSFLCGRLAYYLGLQGPSLAVDTACSSSLVALHLACQSLQRRDCDRALVGGVNAICSPTTNILTCKLKALSPSGHSRAFDAAADGYLRGEGCGVVTIRRLADARRDGDPILGIIKGSAIGHNGFSSGLTAPNPKAQEKVIRQALQRAQLSAADISYLEAHGTGTELGDPIEMQAAAAALAADRSKDNPLLVGSVKTNIGHLEAAAGMAGLIKVLLSMQHDQIPGQLNFETPNPHIAWDKTAVQVLTKATPWPQSNRVAGVSAFGMSGTNAHVIVSAAGPPPVAVTEPETADTPQLITLSGRTQSTVEELADQLQQRLVQDETLLLRDVAYTSNCRRSHFEHRSAIVCTSRNDAITKLKTMARGGQLKGVFVGQGRRPPKIAWQFTGQGSQYAGMSKGLYDAEPVFRQVIDECSDRLKQLHELRGTSEQTLLNVLFEDPNAIHYTRWTQPCIFAVQMGLAKLLQSRGLMPDMVLGHSVGQYAAACVAGVMSWDDGLKLISERGRLIGELPSGGLMLAVFAPLANVEAAISAVNAAHPKFPVSLAANNGTHVVVSGPEHTVADIEERFTANSVRCKRLTTSHAFHSALMDPALAPFRQVADTVTFSRPQLPLICNVSGEVMNANVSLTGDYWANHIRAAVRFGESIRSAQEAGCEVLLELGPQGVLSRMATADWKQSPDQLISCLSKDADDSESFLNAIGQLYVHGSRPDFPSIYAGQQCRSVLLPTYPFQRRRFWGPDKPRAAHAEFHTAHPLLGGKLALAGVSNETRYESFIEADSPSWLPDHEVMGHVIMPGAAYMEMAIAAALETGSAAIKDLVFEQPLRPTSRTSLQTVVRKREDANHAVETWSAAAGSSTWNRNFTATLVKDATIDKPTQFDLKTLQSQCQDVTTAADFYARMQDIGLNYGPDFQTIQSLQADESTVLTRLQTNGDIRGFHIPPTLLDGALHSLAAGLLKDDDDHLFLPVAIDCVQSHRPVTEAVWCVARWTQPEGTTRSADLTLYTESGDPALQINGLKVRQISRAALRQSSGTGAERLVFDLHWQTSRLPSTSVTGKRWAVIAADGDPLSAEIVDHLTTRGNDVRMLSHTANAAEVLEGSSAAMPLHGITWIASDNTQPNCDGLLKLIQHMQQQQLMSLECGLQVVTRNAIVTSESAAGCNAHQTQYWGLGRVIGAEQPGLRCRLIDVPESTPDSAESTSDDTNTSTDTAAAVVDALLTETRDNQLVIRDGQYFVPRLKASKLPAATTFSARSDACYLITGGLGMLGRQAALWLANAGAGQVVLVSRRAPTEQAIAFLDDIRSTGCDVIVHATDLSSENDVAALFQNFGGPWKPLAGVIHAAGILDDGLIGDQSWKRFEPVLAPKIVGGTLLHEFTKSLQLDFFVLYSSAASVLGSPGQSNYATGNAFLDGLAWQRHKMGLPATSINWGPWTEGMANDERIIKRLALQGITPLSVSEAHQAMERILAAGVTQATVMDVDWRRMRLGSGGETPSMLQELAPSKQKSQVGDSQLVARIRKLRGTAQKELLISTVQQSLQRILSTPEAPDVDRPLIEMGLDSLMAVEFGTELQQMLGDQFAVGPTMLFDHPTIDSIADHVLELIHEAGGDAVVTDSNAANSNIPVPDRKAREDVAIVGLSCRFPGAHDVDEFWSNLLSGVDSVREIPNDRWDIDRFYSASREPGKMYTREGGFLDDIADFDAAFFNISDQEACWIDPQHRMLLENTYRALEDAGITPHPLTDNNVGVFMGIMGQDYAFLPTLDDEDVVAAFQGAGLSHSAGVGRISYVFGFEGPSVAVDTASSSSLVALFQAVRSLQDGNCNMALAGGVNAILAPVNSLLMSKAGLLSPDGRCKSFSAAADGFGRGEGCGVVVLKRLSDAQRDGDRIMAVVRGGAVVHNGAGGGITTPSGKSQSRVITEALKDAAIAPSQVQYLEAHGTGTEFGDPMELTAAASVYGKGRRPDNPLLVGSVKANISHLEAAGGISGLIKTVLAMHHGVIPPQAHFDQPSPHIPWQRLPVKMVSETTPWPETTERWAGVTALGLVGTNAHIVLSSAPPAPDDVNTQTVEQPDSHQNATSSEPPRRAQLLVLSARNNMALRHLVTRYETLLNSAPEDFENICHTAAIGRQHHEYRLAVTATTNGDAAQQLAVIANALNNNGTGESASTPRGSTRSPRIAWIFSGDESDTVDFAARELFTATPVFRDLVETFQIRLTEHSQRTGTAIVDLKTWLTESPTTGNQTPPSDNVKLYVLQAGLVHLWQSWGIEPDAVLGFGIGQYTASCVAGGLCFKDALTLVVERDIALQESSEQSFANFEAFADSLNYYPPNLPLICSATGKNVAVHRSLAGSYWRDQLTASPLMAESLQTLIGENCEAWLEIGPAGRLRMNDANLIDGETFTHLFTVQANQSVWSTNLSSLGRLYVQGSNPNFAAMDTQRIRHRVRLPLYPFQKKRYWITEVSRYLDEAAPV